MLEKEVPDVTTLRGMLRRRHRTQQPSQSDHSSVSKPTSGVDNEAKPDSINEENVDFDAALFQISIRRAEPGTVVLPRRGSEVPAAVVTLAGDAMVSAHYRLGV